jgi:hypothetical protein
VPFKANAAGRHHIAPQRQPVTNWSDYDAALRQRGSLTIWFTEAAIAAWRAEPRTTRGGQPHLSSLAITTALTLRAVFRLALRQTEELIGSVIWLFGLNLAIPNHSRLSRRSETRAKDWCVKGGHTAWIATRLSATTHSSSNSRLAAFSAVCPVGSYIGATSHRSAPTRCRPRRLCSITCASRTE